MKLIHRSTGLEVREGDTVHDFRGEVGTVVGWTKPHSPASTGRITVISNYDNCEHHCYPDVYLCEWIDREDREEEFDSTPSLSSVRTADQTTIEQIASMQKRIEELEASVEELETTVHRLTTRLK